MKKVTVLFIAGGLFFQLFSATAIALTYNPGTTTCTSQYGYTTCQCPDGTIVYGTSSCPNTVMCWNGTYAPTQSACPAQVPYCMTPIPGQITIQTASVCRCQDGTYRMSTGGYAYCQQPTQPTTVTCWDGSTAVNESACPGYKYCPGDNTTKRALSYTCPIPNCIEGIPTDTYYRGNISCKCPDGRIITSNGGYATCHIPATCWDGSTAANQSACPAYKYCTGDTVTKRPLSYVCPTQSTHICADGQPATSNRSCYVGTPACYYWNGTRCMANDVVMPPQNQVCWNGQTIPRYQTCPVQPTQPTCTYNQYWNGYSCVTMYNDTYNPYQHPQTDWYDSYNYQQNDWYNSYTQYQPQTNWYDSYQDTGYYQYDNWSNWDSGWGYDDQYYW